ncbi:MAG: hypothetical protein ACOY3I_02960 [Verrucomicrobiota bacterium]
MPNIPEVMEALKQLNVLEDELQKTKKIETQETLKKKIEVEQAKLPKPIQSHHNRIRLKGRPSVAPVKLSASSAGKWLCGCCHIEISRGFHGKLQAASDINVCENCGAYLYLNKEE